MVAERHACRLETPHKEVVQSLPDGTHKKPLGVMTHAPVRRFGVLHQRGECQNELLWPVKPPQTGKTRKNRDCSRYKLKWATRHSNR
jgi:hypothetical protein